MTGDSHYREAERLLRVSVEAEDVGKDSYAHDLVLRAAVHAQLARAAYQRADVMIKMRRAGVRRMRPAHD